ncbi:hypothetical protein RB195_008870 [Necator americanus]|uniref:Uncharacterized protein n=1 Tax=Necator americanus TaxID=51031 RepID=A0ABR1CQQ7_NECAM
MKQPPEDSGIPGGSRSTEPSTAAAGGGGAAFGQPPPPTSVAAGERKRAEIDRRGEAVRITGMSLCETTTNSS